jgi:hypothetical protein
MDDGRVGPDADSALFLWIGNRPPVPDTAAPVGASACGSEALS